MLYRQLLLSSVSTDLAFARGVPVRLAGVLYLLALALAVSLSALTIGAILSTALLVGPAATALRLTSRPGLAMIVSALTGLAATWLGILLAYDSFYWPPRQHGWPVSFFVVTLVFVFYLLALPARSARRPAGRDGLAMFSGFMANTWTVATIAAVVAGRGRALHRAARLGVRRRRGAAGRVRRRGGRQPARASARCSGSACSPWPARWASAGSAAAAATTWRPRWPWW